MTLEAGIQLKESGLLLTMAESKTVLDNCLTLGDISHEEFVTQASNRLYAFRS